MSKVVTIKNNTISISSGIPNHFAGSSRFVINNNSIQIKEKTIKNDLLPLTDYKRTSMLRMDAVCNNNVSDKSLKKFHIDYIYKQLEKLKENPEIKENIKDKFFHKLFAKNEGFKLNKVKIRSKIASLTKVYKGRLKFFTITFPLKTPDDLCFKFLNNWLTVLRSENLINHYIWIAERQQNGTIHFHLVTPHYIPIQLINNYMRQIMRHYSHKHNVILNVKFNTYNGIDVDKISRHKTVSNKAISIYLTKYVTKNNLTIPNHFVWFCSRSVSALFTSQSFETSNEFIDFINSFVNFSKLLFQNEFISIVSFRENAKTNNLINDMIQYNTIILDSFTTCLN